MPKAAHTVDTSGTGKLLMTLPTEVYTAAIGPIVGITLLAGAAPAGSFTETPIAGVKKGLLGYVKISYRAGAKRKQTKLYCSLEKMDTCIAELPGKAFKDGTITSARFSTRRRLR
jgi:hypothetical protein